jgi:IMP dehydrogenase
MQQYQGLSSDSAICFDDILLIPSSNSDVESRFSVDLSMNLGHKGNEKGIITLKLPIIASPMDTVCEYKMAQELSNIGAIGIIHRFMTVENRIQHLKKVDGIKGIAVSLLEAKEKNTIYSLLDAGSTVICIDTANGHAKRAVESVSELRKMVNPNVHIMCGNISTYEGYRALLEAGADSVRVGIGGGSACTTRIVTGHGMPTLSSILDCKKDSNQNEYSIIADGGIRNTGDMVKAFSAGASAVMLGSLLSGYDESPGDIIHDAMGRPVKEFRGMASKEAQENWLGGVSVSEGVSTTVAYKGKITDFLRNIIGGIGSGCSYSGVKKLSELYNNAHYVKVSNSSISESKPHALSLS